MKLINRSIVLSSVIAIGVFGCQQSSDSGGDLHSNLENPSYNSTDKIPVDKKPAKESVPTNSEKQSLSEVEFVEQQTDFETDNVTEYSDTEINVDGEVTVSFDSGLLTVFASNAELTDVLAKISNKAGISIDSMSVDSEQLINLSLNSTIDAVLQELLTGYDYFFLYGGHKGALQAVWIYPKGVGKSIDISSFDRMSGEASEDDLYSSDPVERALALQNYEFTTSKDSQQHIIMALEDEDPDVRASAIMSAQENQIDLSVATLKEMVETDTSASVRSAALDALTLNENLSEATMTEVAEIALDDADESVREEAEAILEGLTETQNSGENSEELQLLEDEEPV